MAKRLVTYAFLLFGAGLTASSCASIVSDAETVTYISTQPEGARCELYGRHGYERIVTTPESVTLHANAAPITVVCRREGYKVGSAELQTTTDGWVLGNILFGGMIGMAVDTAGGAGKDYQERMSIVLVPNRFGSLAELNGWYDERRRTVETEWEATVSQIESRCAKEVEDSAAGIGAQPVSAEAAACRKKVERASQQRDEAIAKIEDDRRVAIAEWTE
jgi:hypothetical protein